MLKNLLFSCIILSFSFSVLGQVSENNYRVYSVKLSKEISLNEIVEEMNNNHVLFFGEEHNDSVTHFIENKLFELLYSKYSDNIALSLEMFDRDIQSVMNEYLKGLIREKNFTKDARAWSNYRDYRPMIEFAKANKLDVICANAPSRYTNLAGRKGQIALLELHKDAKKNIAPLPYDTASGNYYEKLLALTQHTPTVSNDSIKPKIPMMSMGQFNLIVAQSLWDATMAFSIAEYFKKNKQKKIMHVNGRFHSDEGFAAVTQLKNYNAKIKSLIISTGSDKNFPNIEWNQYKHLGDFIIITDPNVPKTY